MQKLAIGFLPVGNVKTEEMKGDIEVALKNLRGRRLEIVSRPASSNLQELLAYAKELEAARLDTLVLFCIHGSQALNLVRVAEGTGLPVMIWALPVRYSLPASASAIGNLREKGLRVKLLYGAASSTLTVDELLRVTKALHAIRRLRETRIGKIGGLQGGAYVSGNFDKEDLHDRFGVEVVDIRVKEVMDAFEEVAEEQVEDALKEWRKRFQIIEAGEQDLRKATRLHLALKKLFKKYGLSAVVMDLYEEIGQIFRTSSLLIFAEDLVMQYEGDIISIIASLLVKYLADKPVYLTDIFSIDLEKSLLTVLHASAPASLAKDDSKVHIGTDTPPLGFGDYTIVTVKPEIPPGPVTILRLFGRNCDQVHLTTGQLLSCDVKKEMIAKIKIMGDIKKFIDTVCGNHYLIVPGDIKKELYETCEWLDIKITET
jgi:L-fucose isomerase-like protein